MFVLLYLWKRADGRESVNDGKEDKTTQRMAAIEFGLTGRRRSNPLLTFGTSHSASAPGLLC